MQINKDITTEIIQRAQSGDKTTIAMIYDRYHLSIFRYLYYRVGDEQLAEDLTSDVFVRMLRFIGGFKPPVASFQAWLFQIARNISHDYYRKASTEKTVPLDGNPQVPDVGFQEKFEHILTSDHPRRALEQLKEDQRDVIILRFVNGLLITEAAQVMNRSEDAVKGLQRRALMGLREILLEWETSNE